MSISFGCIIVCGVLQCVAVCGSVLQFVAVRCSVPVCILLECIDVCGLCSVLQCVVVRCSVSVHTA